MLLSMNGIVECLSGSPAGRVEAWTMATPGTDCTPLGQFVQDQKVDRIPHVS